MARICSALAVITGEQAIGIEIMKGVGDKQQSLINARRESRISREQSASQSNPEER